MSDVRQVGIADVPDAIRDKVIAEARDRDISISSLVVEIVGRCHGLDLPANGQRLRKGTAGDPPWVIRMPIELAMRIARAQQTGGGRRVAKSRLILACLADHYDLPAESPLNRSLAQPRGEGGRFMGRS
jgi:hypothetical protein